MKYIINIVYNLLKLNSQNIIGKTNSYIFKFKYSDKFNNLNAYSSKLEFVMLYLFGFNYYSNKLNLSIIPKKI